MHDSDREYEFELPINAPQSAVWKALTEAREIERWFATAATCDARLGGELTWRWGDQHTWRQTIEAITPSVHLRTRYDSGVADGHGGKRPLFVDFHLEGTGGTTTLRLVHSGFGPEADFDAEFDGIRSGWPVELGSLRHYLERHPGRDRIVAWHEFATQTPPEVAWQRLIAPDALAAPHLADLRAGQPFAIQVPGIGRLSGATLCVPTPREFSGVAREFDDAWLRVHCERWGGATRIWLWLAVYAGDPQRVADVQRAFATLLARLFVADDTLATGGAHA